MHFEKVTEIKCNKTKCIGIWVESDKDNPRKPLGFKKNSDTKKSQITPTDSIQSKHRNKAISIVKEKKKKLRKKNLRRYMKVGAFTAITYRKENINKPGTIKY